MTVNILNGHVVALNLPKVSAIAQWVCYRRPLSIYRQETMSVYIRSYILVVVGHLKYPGHILHMKKSYPSFGSMDTGLGAIFNILLQLTSLFSKSNWAKSFSDLSESCVVSVMQYCVFAIQME